MSSKPFQVFTINESIYNPYIIKEQAFGGGAYSCHA
jgi:hypothetical protein